MQQVFSFTASSLPTKMWEVVLGVFVFVIADCYLWIKHRLNGLSLVFSELWDNAGWDFVDFYHIHRLSRVSLIWQSCVNKLTLLFFNYYLIYVLCSCLYLFVCLFFPWVILLPKRHCSCSTRRTCPQKRYCPIYPITSLSVYCVWIKIDHAMQKISQLLWDKTGITLW